VDAVKLGNAPAPAAARPPAADPVRLHVCHVAATTEGAVWVFEQLHDLRDRFGYRVTVILNGSSGTLVDRFNAAGIRVLVSDFQFLGTGDLMALPRKIRALARLFAEERFDIVQTHLFHSMVIGRTAAWLADVPVRLSMVAGPFHLEAYTPRSACRRASSLPATGRAFRRRSNRSMSRCRHR
jgi:hypothetical protein